MPIGLVALSMSEDKCSDAEVTVFAELLANTTVHPYHDLRYACPCHWVFFYEDGFVC